MNDAMRRRPILLFDVMDTLVVDPFFEAIPAFFALTLDELLASKHPTAWVEFEEGRIDEAQYLSRFFQDGRRVDGEGLRRCLQDTYAWIDGMQHIVRELHAAGFELHALSNYPIWYRMIERQLEMSRYVNWTFVSCNTGLRKPHPRAYLNAAERVDAAPSDCLFIDDRPVNVEAAISVGMDAILKIDATQLRDELSTRQLI